MCGIDAVIYLLHTVGEVLNCRHQLESEGDESTEIIPGEFYIQHKEL